MMFRKKTCYFCDKPQVAIDYRNPHLRNFLNEKGKIIPRKISGVCARHQRILANTIKRARNLALLPFVIK